MNGKLEIPIAKKTIILVNKMNPRLKTLILASICIISFTTIWFSPALSSRPDQVANPSNSSSLLQLPPLPAMNATIRTSPSNITATVGTNVTIRFMISDASDVYAWQLYVRWNPSILKFVTLTSGDFLNKEEQVNITRIPDEYVDIQVSLSKVETNMGALRVYRLYENESGRLLIGETRLGPRSGMSGNGTLCSVVFQIMSPGNTMIDIATATDFSSYVIDGYIRELPSIIQNGLIIGAESSEPFSG